MEANFRQLMTPTLSGWGVEVTNTRDALIFVRNWSNVALKSQSSSEQDREQKIAEDDWRRCIRNAEVLRRGLRPNNREDNIIETEFCRETFYVMTCQDISVIMRTKYV